VDDRNVGDGHALWQGHEDDTYTMFRAYLGMLAMSSGTWFRAGMRVPTDEYDG
jgi:hypothetical protein